MSLLAEIETAGARPVRNSKGEPAPTTANAATDPPAPPAQPPPLTEALTAEARASYDAGKLLYSDGDYAGALVKLGAAYDASRDPRLLWNMAACEKNLRHYAKVLALVRKYIATGGDLITEQDRKDASDLLTTVEAFTVALTLTVNESGAAVYVDGERVGTTPLPEPLIVDIGTRRVRVKKAGFAEFTASIPVGGAPSVEQAIVLFREVHRGRLSVNAGREAEISMDGRAVGRGRWSASVPSGGHTLRVTAPKMRAYQSEIVISDNETRTVDVSLEPIPENAPAPEKTGVLHGFEVGVRSAYGVAFTGDAGTVGFVPLWLDIGYRLGRPTYLGLYAEWGYLDRSGTCGVDRHGPEPTSASDVEIRYAYERCNMAKAGVLLAFHLLPRTIVDPWFGFDVGVKGTFTKYTSYDPLTRGSRSGEDDSASIQPGLQIGVDAHPWKAVSAGVFGQGGPGFGGEGRPKDNGTSIASPSNCGNGSCCSPGQSCSGSEDHGTHPTAHLLFGARLAYTFP